LGREKFAQGEGPLCLNPLPVKLPIASQNDGIQNTVYREFRSKMTPALKAILHFVRKAEKIPWNGHVHYQLKILRDRE